MPPRPAPHQVKMMSLCHGWGRQPPPTASTIHIRHIQSTWAHWYHVHRHRVFIWLTSYTDPTWLRCWGSGVTCGVKMMSLHHGWGWYPIQTDSCIHIRCLQSVWAHSYPVHRHMVAALHHSYTHPTWFWFWGSGVTFCTKPFDKRPN